MLKKIASLVAVAIIAFLYYHFYLYDTPSFPTTTETALLVYLNENCSKAELGLDESVEDWTLVEAWPSKKPPAWEKEQIYTRKVNLKGWYLPEGKAGKSNYLRFKAKLTVEVNVTEPKTPIFKKAE